MMIQFPWAGGAAFGGGGGAPQIPGTQEAAGWTPFGSELQAVLRAMLGGNTLRTAAGSAEPSAELSPAAPLLGENAGEGAGNTPGLPTPANEPAGGTPQFPPTDAEAPGTTTPPLAMRLPSTDSLNRIFGADDVRAAAWLERLAAAMEFHELALADAREAWGRRLELLQSSNEAFRERSEQILNLLLTLSRERKEFFDTYFSRLAAVYGVNPREGLDVSELHAETTPSTTPSEAALEAGVADDAEEADPATPGPLESAEPAGNDAANGVPVAAMGGWLQVESSLVEAASSGGTESAGSSAIHEVHTPGGAPAHGDPTASAQARRQGAPQGNIAPGAVIGTPPEISPSRHSSVAPRNTPAEEPRQPAGETRRPTAELRPSAEARATVDAPRRSEPRVPSRPAVADSRPATPAHTDQPRSAVEPRTAAPELGTPPRPALEQQLVPLARGTHSRSPAEPRPIGERPVDPRVAQAPVARTDADALTDLRANLLLDAAQRPEQRVSHFLLDRIAEPAVAASHFVRNTGNGVLPGATEGAGGASTPTGDRFGEAIAASPVGVDQTRSTPGHGANLRPAVVAPSPAAANATVAAAAPVVQRSASSLIGVHPEENSVLVATAPREIARPGATAPSVESVASVKPETRAVGMAPETDGLLSRTRLRTVDADGASGKALDSDGKPPGPAPVVDRVESRPNTGSANGPSAFSSRAPSASAAVGDRHPSTVFERPTAVQPDSAHDVPGISTLRRDAAGDMTASTATPRPIAMETAPERRAHQDLAVDGASGRSAAPQLRPAAAGSPAAERQTEPGADPRHTAVDVPNRGDRGEGSLAHRLQESGRTSGAAPTAAAGDDASPQPTGAPAGKGRTAFGEEGTLHLRRHGEGVRIGNPARSSEVFPLGYTFRPATVRTAGDAGGTLGTGLRLAGAPGNLVRPAIVDTGSSLGDGAPVPDLAPARDATPVQHAAAPVDDGASAHNASATEKLGIRSTPSSLVLQHNGERAADARDSRPASASSIELGTTGRDGAAHIAVHGHLTVRSPRIRGESVPDAVRPSEVAGAEPVAAPRDPLAGAPAARRSDESTLEQSASPPKLKFAGVSADSVREPRVGDAAAGRALDALEANAGLRGAALNAFGPSAETEPSPAAGEEAEYGEPADGVDPGIGDALPGAPPPPTGDKTGISGSEATRGAAERLSWATTTQPERLEQIVRSVLATAEDNVVRELQIRLVPEHLGEMQLRLVLENGALRAQFVAETDTARQALEQSLPVLQELLESHGMEIRELSVSIGRNTSHFSAGDGSHGGFAPRGDRPPTEAHPESRRPQVEPQYWEPIGSGVNLLA